MIDTGMLTFDVEDWHHANFSQLRGKQDAILQAVTAARYPMDRNVDRWLETLKIYSATSTCFVLGEFANKYPHAVKRIHAQGHEIACHGLTHDLIYEMSQSQFREWLTAATGTLAELTGQTPAGFRAPSWSVDSRTPWFCEELERAGYRYDSSEFPIRTPLFGNSKAPTRSYRVGSLQRFPVTVIEWAGARIPFSSGAFFRLAPLFLIQFGIRRAQRLGVAPMLVLHPRELDPEHPRLPLKGWERSIHYARLQTTIPKLESVLSMMKWRSIFEHLKQLP